MPVYFAGWIKSDATIGSGTGFTVTRRLSVGSYRITIPATPSGRPLVAVVTPMSSAILLARLVAYTHNADGSHTIDFDMRNVASSLTDSDFTFIAVETR
jgi:hypothetical protein